MSASRHVFTWGRTNRIELLGPLDMTDRAVPLVLDSMTGYAYVLSKVASAILTSGSGTGGNVLTVDSVIGFASGDVLSVYNALGTVSTQTVTGVNTAGNQVQCLSDRSPDEAVLAGTLIRARIGSPVTMTLVGATPAVNNRDLWGYAGNFLLLEAYADLVQDQDVGVDIVMDGEIMATFDASVLKASA